MSAPPERIFLQWLGDVVDEGERAELEADPDFTAFETSYSVDRVFPADYEYVLRDSAHRGTHCACRFDDDDRPVKQCGVHARAQRDADRLRGALRHIDALLNTAHQGMTAAWLRLQISEVSAIWKVSHE